jgi:cobalt/nickel transport protein
MKNAKRRARALLFGFIMAFVVLVLAAAGEAHFQILIPQTNIIGADDPKDVNLDIIFGHPMEGPTMEMGRPARFGVVIAGEQKKDLLPALKEVKAGGHAAYKCDFKVGVPGDYVFFIEPAPYWEPAEEKMIIHYTKVVVNVMGDETGWDAEVELPVEIIPLVRPYGLWTGNIFRAIVKQDGKAVPYAEVEVEYYNRGGELKAPADAYVTQVIKADGSGVFAYAMPREGWWGFAALCEGGKMKNPEGKEVDIEAGGVFWVFCRDMK